MSTGEFREELHFHAPYPSIALAGFGLAVAAGLVEVLAGLGNRMGWWFVHTAITLVIVAAVASLIAAALDIVSSLFLWSLKAKHILLLAVAGVVLGGIGTGIPASWLRTEGRSPMIHDITTDMTTPPAFVAILPLRKNAPNTAVYAGPKLAAAQRAAYPGVRPLFLPVSRDDAFRTALAEAHKMGWHIVATDPREGRIEATARTFWFGFTDDIVVRISSESGASRIDVRSASRQGLSDLGTNARRIVNYLTAIAMAS